MSLRIDPFKSQKIIEKGMRAGSELGCCSCKDTNCAILTTSMIAGGIIGTCVAPGPGTGIGVCAGFGVGLIIVLVKESIKKNECVIL
jgi:hypothetical protein